MSKKCFRWWFLFLISILCYWLFVNMFVLRTKTKSLTNVVYKFLIPKWLWGSSLPGKANIILTAEQTHFLSMYQQTNRPISTKQTHYQPRLWESKRGLNRKLCRWNWALRNPTLQSARLLLEILKRVFAESNKNCFAITGFDRNPEIVFPDKLCHEWDWWGKELRSWFWKWVLGLVMEERGL